MLKSAFDLIRSASERGKNTTEGHLKLGLEQHLIHKEHYEDVRDELNKAGFTTSLEFPNGSSPKIIIGW